MDDKANLYGNPFYEKRTEIKTIAVPKSIDTFLRRKAHEEKRSVNSLINLLIIEGLGE